MTFLLDENMPRRFAELLPHFGIDVRDLRSEFGGDLRRDTDWIPAAAARGWIILTYDRKIATRPDECRAYTEAGAVILILYGRQHWTIRHKLGWLLLYRDEIVEAAGSRAPGTCSRMDAQGGCSLCRIMPPGSTSRGHP